MKRVVTRNTKGCYILYEKMGRLIKGTIGPSPHVRWLLLSFQRRDIDMLICVKNIN